MKKQTKPANSGNKRDKFSPKDTPSRQESLLFPIVGIGASAGGLEALEVELRAENERQKRLLEAGG